MGRPVTLTTTEQTLTALFDQAAISAPVGTTQIYVELDNELSAFSVELTVDGVHRVIGRPAGTHWFMGLNGDVLGEGGVSVKVRAGTVATAGVVGSKALISVFGAK